MNQAKVEDSAYTDLPQQGTAPEQGVFVFPASLEQIRYWTLNQLDGASTASNMAIAARLEGTLDDALVERAVHALVERHEALRTTFQVVDGHLAQIISEQARLSFQVSDLRNLPEPARVPAAEAAIEEHSHARADLAQGPAFFVRLIHLTAQSHILAFTMHHIVCDGWSNGILIRDFADFYTAFVQNREPSLPELPFQFADFTVWQQNWLESDAAQSALAYWRTQIQRNLPAVDLPTDSPRQPGKSFPGHIESTLLSESLAARLKAYCRTRNATMHQLMLAAFEALIARYTNQSEFLLGSTIANRTQPGMENVVGRFANPQVILADVSGDPSYAELLRRVTEWSTESYAHQDLPFSRLMEEFQLDQAGATSQFLQVYFVYQKAFMQPQEAPGLRVTPRPSVSGGVNFDLLVSVVERAEGPRLQMEYNTVLFRRERILSLIEMYVSVLEAVMDDDTVTVSRLPLRSATGNDAATGSRSQTQFAPGIATQAALLEFSLPEWIDRQAELRGDTDAIVLGPERVSWKALRERSQTMAANLLALGVAPGQTVALRLDTSANAAAAAWALLRIGATVVPVPFSTGPSEWVALVAAHSLALANADFVAAAPGITPLEHLLSPSAVQVPPGYIAPASPAWMALSAFPDGEPTAIPATHAATLRSLQAAAAALDLRAGDVVLATPANAATDAWVDLLLPLVSGATLLYPAPAKPGERQPWEALLGQHAVSFAFLSAPDALAAVHRRWQGDRRLNLVLRGGLLTPSQVDRLSATPIRLWSIVTLPLAAGPMAIARISGQSQPRFTGVDSQPLVVLDDNDHPAPDGVSGELALHGDSQFVRTGLLARTAPGGLRTSEIEILDTVDRLVRLHGYRLRLGELEDLLWQDPNVADVVAALVPVADIPTLAAYVETFESDSNSARDVQSRFQTIAPGHLATAELIAVDSLPRRPDGSVSLALLPPPGSATGSESSAEEFVAPRDALESSLVAIWEEVLGVRPIGIRTPFFRLGGYSLMIVRLFGRINKALGTSLPITTIFNAPTVEQLADIVRGRAYYSSLVPVQPQGSHPPFFMIHSYLLYQGLPAVLGPDQPFYGLRELDTDAANMTVEQRASAYLDAMRSIQPHGPYHIGGWCAAGPLAVETARQIAASGEKVGFLVLFDSWRPGYAAELTRQQAGTAEMTLASRLGRKYRFHRNRLRPLSTRQRASYFAKAIAHKFAAVRDRLYLKNWAIAEWFCRFTGLQLPHFMHNVSLTTLNSLKEYRGIEAYTGSLTLIRAKEAPYLPGAKQDCGWASIVTGGVNVLWAPGDHKSMFMDPHLQTVGALLRQSLAEAYERERSESLRI